LERFDVIRTVEEASWRCFLEGQAAGSVFHTPEMFEVFSRARGHRPAVWAAVDERGSIAAMMMPVEISVIDRPFVRHLTTRMVAYGGVLADGGDRGVEGAAWLLRTYGHQVGRLPLYTEIRNVHDPARLCPAFGSWDSEHEAHLNFLVDLRRPAEDIWQGISSAARRNVRKAEKQGVIVETVTTADGLIEAYRLLHDVYKHISVPLPDLSLFEGARDVLIPRRMLRILAAKVDGRMIGVLNLLVYNGVATYWYTGALRESSQYRPADFLVWRGIEAAIEAGAHTFDFGGGGKPDEEYGVRDFKAKFGGELVDYGREIAVHAPIRYRFSKRGYELLRRFL
jgi:serine/alanine adding enzyme